MRPRLQPFALPLELGDFADEVRRAFQELGRSAEQVLNGECSPAVDVFETDDAVKIVVDLAGVEHSAIRILVKHDAVLVVGQKTPRRRATGEATFHLVERAFGRFARVVRLDCACATTTSRASLSNGQLHITVPKIQDRRGRVIPIAIESTPAQA